MDFKTLLQNEDRIVFRCISGSNAYGTAHENSDTDIKGIFMVPSLDYFGFDKELKQVSDDTNDTVYYSLRRFIELALDANPNIIELLFMPDECELKTSSYFDYLKHNRDLFITKKAFDSHINYAMAQIRKAKGKNKWVNNPQPEEPPRKEDYCWFLDGDNNTPYPFRPMPLSEKGIDLNRCHVAAMEHVSEVFRLYDYGDKAKGVFRNGMLVCESIPKKHEQEKFIGLLIYHKHEYDRAKRDHENYWAWVENRNQHRWKSQELGLIDYDAKNMMHTFRLLISGKHILEHGTPLVRFTGENLLFLKSILNGEFRYEELIQRAEGLVSEMHIKKQNSCLHEEPDIKKAQNLLRQITKDWENDNA
jgi:predicted nucleotidyltransferase